MANKPIGAIEEHFGKVSDPRIERTKEHKLIDNIVIAICAVICGAEGWVDIENYGKRKKKWLKTFLELANGIPSHDTFGRVFSLLDSREFQAAFCSWVVAVNEITQGQIINVDGKCMLGSEDKVIGKRAIYMVSAWAEANHVVLGQRKVDEKSNEITAIPELLKILAISGCIVTIDAIVRRTDSVTVHQSCWSFLPVCSNEAPHLPKGEYEVPGGFLPSQPAVFHLLHYVQSLYFIHAHRHSFIHKVTFSLNNSMVSNSLNMNTNIR